MYSELCDSRAQYHVVKEVLKVLKVFCVIGHSMGGQQAGLVSL